MKDLKPILRKDGSKSIYNTDGTHVYIGRLKLAVKLEELSI